jgi:hypothetical protein
MAHIHREPYITLAALTESSALIAWGAFFFDVNGQEMDGRFKIIEDKDLKFINPPRETSIGESSNFYGPARVQVLEKKNPGQVIEVEVKGETPESRVNHAWVNGLKPDTEYQYRVFVKDEPWAEEERRDWVFINGKQGMFPNKRFYENEFRTYPLANQATPDLAFAVIGDYGRGVKKPSTSENRQREIALALEQAVRTMGMRFVLTTGDNVYAGGGADSDWFFTHYQPYRYILNRVPFYPSCGNHDTDETEGSDDYTQLLDNFYIRQRFFSGNRDEGDAVKDKGLFYNFRFGRDVEFISIDSARHWAMKNVVVEDIEALQLPTTEEFLRAELGGERAVSREQGDVEIDSPIHDADDIPKQEETPNLGDDIFADSEDESGLDIEGIGEESFLLRAASSTSWRVAKSLLVLRDQVNRKAPRRRKDSDGTIGDAAHQSRVSDHNPWVRDGGIGVVTAMDITHDPNNGCDANVIAEALRSSREVRVKYIIFNRRIANSSPIGSAKAWEWRPYVGPKKNPHTKHIHISVKSNKSNYDSTAAWPI